MNELMNTKGVSCKSLTATPVLALSNLSIFTRENRKIHILLFHSELILLRPNSSRTTGG